MEMQYKTWQERPLTYGCLLRGLIIYAAILVALGACILWVLNAQNIIQGPWASLFTAAFVILGVIFAFLQWYFPRPPINSKKSIDSSETAITPTLQALKQLEEKEKSKLRERDPIQRTGTLVIWTTDERQTITLYLLDRNEFVKCKTSDQREGHNQKKIVTITGEIIGTQLLYTGFFRGLEPRRYSVWKQEEYHKDKAKSREIQIEEGKISFKHLDW